MNINITNSNCTAPACFFSIGNIINGFFNPEYWALKEILSSCK